MARIRSNGRSEKALQLVSQSVRRGHLTPGYVHLRPAVAPGRKKPQAPDPVSFPSGSCKIAESRRKWLHLDTNSTNTFHYATGTYTRKVFCYRLFARYRFCQNKQRTKQGTITARPQHPSCQYRDDRPVYAHRGQPGLCISKHRFYECIRLDDPTLHCIDR